MTSSIDSRQMPVEQAQEWQRLIDGLNLEELAKTPARGPQGADRFQYDLVITSGGERYQLVLNDPAVPDPLKPIVERMTALARRG